MVGALALVTGVILFCTGLLGEVLTRTYFESQGRRIYAVREIRTRRETQPTDAPRHPRLMLRGAGCQPARRFLTGAGRLPDDKNRSSGPRAAGAERLPLSKITCNSLKIRRGEIFIASQARSPRPRQQTTKPGSFNYAKTQSSHLRLRRSPLHHPTEDRFHTIAQEFGQPRWSCSRSSGPIESITTRASSILKPTGPMSPKPPELRSTSQAPRAHPTRSPALE